MENCPILSALSIFFGSLFLLSCESNKTPDESDAISIQQVPEFTSESVPDLEKDIYCPQRSETGGQLAVSLEPDGPCRPAIGKARATVIRLNLAPNANAGEDQLVVPPATITLDGGGSSDSDGSIASYSWNQIFGSPIQLAQPDGQIIQFDTPVGSTSHFLVFELSVTDDDGAVSTDRVSVIVRPDNPPGNLVTVWNDDLIIRELDSDELVVGNLFDLEGRTLRFSPEGEGYRVQSIPFQWDADFGSEIDMQPSDEQPSEEVTLTNFQFPFSGATWSSFFVGSYGNITFGMDQRGFHDGARDGRLLFRTYSGSMVNTIPIISPLFRKFSISGDPDRVGHRFVKELSDRVVITWTVSEPYGGGTSFTNDPRMNRFQVVLLDNGEIDFSYESIAVEDGIVGVFPLSTAQQLLDTILDAIDGNIPSYIDMVRVDVSLVGNHSLRFAFTFRGDVLPEGDPRLAGISYEVFVYLGRPIDSGPPDVRLSIFAFDELTYQTSGPGVSPNVEINGSTISITVGLDALGGLDRFDFFTNAVDWDDLTIPENPPDDRTNPITVDLPPIVSSEVDLSSSSPTDPDREVIYEAFHYPDVPSEEALICSVIGELGDRFDFLAFYTDFRIDRQGAGASGLGPPSCFRGGQFQWGQEPTYIDVPIFAESGADRFGSFDNYNRHIDLLAHEIGHRWLATEFATIAGQDIRIADQGPHWEQGLHAPVAFPISQNTAASIMGGNYWQDNGDGTFTRLNQSVFIGYSYLDLYLMGFLAEQDVPDFFLIENFGGVANPIVSGDRLNLTVGNVIAHNGPRLPSFENSQKDFNMGFVGIVQNQQLPSLMLLERMAGVRQEWLGFWSAATGGVSTMRSSP